MRSAMSIHAQMDEFVRLYGRTHLSHIDGHQHRHVCANMLLAEVIPTGRNCPPDLFYAPSEKRPNLLDCDGRLVDPLADASVSPD